ncbi:response regulator [Labilibaculum sp. K2S]|uniref:hybrid sensor histidine kinase/response regulator n=1 Tax=Labilibaculum sp. K2S TaxID=3056386 RepID=UPI0025A362A1|nr:PAS domain-containing hybrid sensor histidine kinase/response regulator [Labilibaculum sp. K2S]MDM8158385.1 response regulator [Labilibaculum sp. K2S]
MKNDLHHEIIKSLPYPYYVIEVGTYKVVDSNDPNFIVNQDCCDLILSNAKNYTKKDHCKCSVNMVLKEKKTIKTKLKNINIKGELKNIWVHASPIFNSNQEITHVIEYFIDITEQEILHDEVEAKTHDLEAITDLSRLNSELSETTNKYKALFENSPESLWEEDFTVLMLTIEDLKSKGVTDFRSYFDEHPELLIELSQQVIIVDVNQATVNLYKAKSKEDLIGNLAKTFMPESLSVFKEELLAIINGENSFKKEAKVITLEGEVVDAIIKLFYTKHNDKFIAYVSTTDITARKESETALQKSQNIFELVMDNIDALVYVSDIETYEILFMNKRMKDKFGDNIGAKCFSTMQAGETEPCSFCTNHLIINDGKPSEIYNWEFKNPLTNRWYYISDLAIEWIDGRIVRFEIATDITSLKESDIELKQKNDEFLRLNAELERTNKEYELLNLEYKTINSEILKTNTELKKAKEKAIESDHLKSAFLANMSHEIRTPMNTIIGFSDLLGQPNLTLERRHKFLKLVQSSSEHLLRIIDDIIDVSKLESNQLKVNTKSCLLNELLYEIKESQSMIKIVKNKNDITLQLNIPQNTENLNITCDPTRFRQIVYNLVSNAFKYTEKGFVEIGYSISHVDSMVHLYVKDTGFGIQAEMFQLIFERFRQIENQHLQEGTGIGLSIVKGLVHLLGGKIWIESKVNEGSTFHFTIPISEQSKPVIEKNETPQIANSLNLSECLVYVAEDDISSFLLLEELLQTTEVKLKHAVNGEELINLINSHTPDLILLDINMPVINGFEAMNKIRKTHPSIPVIAQTAYAMVEEREKCIAAGCTDYISKPINSSLLLEKIRKYLTFQNNPQ